jgi:hypothetical protein
MAVHQILPLELSKVSVPARSFACPDGLRLATQVRGIPDVQALLICSVAQAHSCSRTAYELALGLVQMNQAPVLLVNVNSPTGRSERSTFRPDPAHPVELISLPSSGEDFQITDQLSQPVLIANIDESEAVHILSSPEFACFLAHARKRFQYILVTAPPVLRSVGSLVAAPLCDGTILSIAAHRTTLSEVQNAKRQLVGANTKIVGFIFDESAGRA